MSDQPWCCFIGCDKDAEFELGEPLTKADYPVFDTEAAHAFSRQLENSTHSCADHIDDLLEEGWVVERIEESSRQKLLGY